MARNVLDLHGHIGFGSCSLPNGSRSEPIFLGIFYVLHLGVSFDWQVVLGGFDWQVVQRSEPSFLPNISHLLCTIWFSFIASFVLACFSSSSSPFQFSSFSSSSSPFQALSFQEALDLVSLLAGFDCISPVPSSPLSLYRHRGLPNIGYYSLRPINIIPV